MRAIEDSEQAATLARAADAFRASAPDLAKIFDGLADIERRIDRIECEQGLRRYLNAGRRIY